MIVLAGADIVLPDQIITNGSLAIRNGVIEAVLPTGAARAAWTVIDLSGHTIVPGFVDVHVHGLEGIDVLEGPDAVSAVAARLPRHGVTAFCPTSLGRRGWGARTGRVLRVSSMNKRPASKR